MPRVLSRATLSANASPSALATSLLVCSSSAGSSVWSVGERTTVRMYLDSCAAPSLRRAVRVGGKRPRRRRAAARGARSRRARASCRRPGRRPGRRTGRRRWQICRCEATRCSSTGRSRCEATDRCDAPACAPRRRVAAARCRSRSTASRRLRGRRRASRAAGPACAGAR